MKEYGLMLFFVCAGSTLAWVFFRHLARMAIWSSRPVLDAWRYGLITVCLAIEISNAFEVWEATMLRYQSGRSLLNAKRTIPLSICAV